MFEYTCACLRHSRCSQRSMMLHAVVVSRPGLWEGTHLIFHLEVSTVCFSLSLYSSATYFLSAFIISMCLPCSQVPKAKTADFSSSTRLRWHLPDTH